MRKLLSLVLAFAMILGLFAFPVSADATTYQQVGQELVGLGVLKGVDEKGTLAEMQNLTREQALVVLTRLMGQEDKALATDAQPGFTDVPAAHWYSPYVAYAKLQGWTTGVSETEFGLGQSVTTKQVVTLMMRALGYEADWAKEDIMKKAKELGLLEGVSATADDAIIRGELFIVMKNTLYTKPMGEKTELIYKLGLAENPIPATLEVVDVKATNLRQITVEFNQEVDKDTLENAFSSVGLNLSKVVINVQEDGKTVLLTLHENMKNKKDYKITISKVKSLSGTMMEKTVKEFKTEDNQVPTVEKLVVTGPREFDVYFSEPLKVAGKVKLMVEKKNGPGASVVDFDVADEVVHVKAGSALKDGTTYTVLVTGFEDFAGYKNIDSELELEYAKVTTPPTAEVVKATQEYVVVKFDRPVKGLKLNNFYHTYSAWKPYHAFDSEKAMKEYFAKRTVVPTQGVDLVEKSRDEVVVRFLDTVDRFVAAPNNEWHPLQVGEVEFNVLGQVGSRKVVDNWGNQLQDTELKLTISADKTAPVIESVEASGESKIEIKFSKSVLFDRNNYEILKEDGSKFAGSFTGSVDGKVVTLDLKGVALVGKTVILNVKNVKDDTINVNKMVGTESFNITFGDKTFDGLKEVYLRLNPNQDNVFVLYKEAVDSASATDINNYKFTYEADGTKQFSISADTSMYSNSVVQLAISKNTLKKLTTEVPSGKRLYIVVSNNVKDLAGNSWGSFTVQKEVTTSDATLAPVLVDKDPIVATNKKTIVMKFDQPLQVKGAVSLDLSKFEIKAKKEFSSAVETVKPLTAEISDEKNIELTLPEGYALDTNLTANTVKYLGGMNDGSVINELEVPLKAFTAEQPIKDTLAPEFTLVQEKEGKHFFDVTYSYTKNPLPGKKKHEITINFTEDINMGYVDLGTFVVKGGDGHAYTMSTVDTSVANKLVYTFDVPKDRVDTVVQGLKDSFNQEVRVKKSDSSKWYTYFTLEVANNHKVLDSTNPANGKQLSISDLTGGNQFVPVFHTTNLSSFVVDGYQQLEDLIKEVKAWAKNEPAGQVQIDLTQDLPPAAAYDKSYVNNTVDPAKTAFEKLTKPNDGALAVAEKNFNEKKDLKKSYDDLKAAFDAWKQHVKTVAPELRGVDTQNGTKLNSVVLEFTTAVSNTVVYKVVGDGNTNLLDGQKLDDTYTVLPEDKNAMVGDGQYLVVAEVDSDNKVLSFVRLDSFAAKVRKAAALESFTVEGDGNLNSFTMTQVDLKTKPVSKATVAQFTETTADRFVPTFAGADVEKLMYTINGGIAAEATSTQAIIIPKAVLKPGEGTVKGVAEIVFTTQKAGNFEPVEYRLTIEFTEVQ